MAWADPSEFKDYGQILDMDLISWWKVDLWEPLVCGWVCLKAPRPLFGEVVLFYPPPPHIKMLNIVLFCEGSYFARVSFPKVSLCSFFNVFISNVFYLCALTCSFLVFLRSAVCSRWMNNVERKMNKTWTWPWNSGHLLLSISFSYIRN